MMRHLSEKYPSRSKAAKPIAKPPRNRAPPSVRPGPAKLDRQLSRDGDTGYKAVIEELPLPAGYTGPKMTSDMTMQARSRPARSRPLTLHTRHSTAGLPPPPLPASTTWQGATSLLAHIKAHVAKDAPGPAVPKRVAMQILLRIKQVLEAKDESLSELQFDTGRLVIVGDTHGQINDFCWILRSHGLPAPGNTYVTQAKNNGELTRTLTRTLARAITRYLINGDVADRGKNAVEILLCIFAFMLAAPGTIHMNRGNHESLDMNVRSFRDGGGFAVEVGGKYGSDAFTLFQARSHAFTHHPRHSCTHAPTPMPARAPLRHHGVFVTCGPRGLLRMCFRSSHWRRASTRKSWFSTAACVGRARPPSSR